LIENLSWARDVNDRGGDISLPTPRQFVETRPRRDVGVTCDDRNILCLVNLDRGFFPVHMLLQHATTGPSQDPLKTETSRPRPQHWVPRLYFLVNLAPASFQKTYTTANML